MVWRGTDRARVVALAGAGSMSGATAWGGRCGGQQAGASTMHRSIHPYNLPAKSSTVPPKEYSAEEYCGEGASVAASVEHGRRRR